MAEYRINIEDILSATDGGLDIILAVYPQAGESLQGRNKKFKLRDNDKTPSANLYKNKDGIWLITDFGDGTASKGANGIDCYMRENGIDFITAINELAIQYNVQGADPSKAPKPIRTTEPADPKQAEEKYYYTVREGFTEKEIETLFPKYALTFIGWKKTGADGKINEERQKRAHERVEEVCRKYNFWALQDIRYIKNREATVYSSNEDYPMFAWIEMHNKQSFAKLYEPKHIDKSKRFKYSGTKPKDFIHGLQQAEEEYTEREKLSRTEQEYDDEGEPIKTKKKAPKVEKIDQLLYLSGGSDALTAALLGYWVTWPNSETAALDEFAFKKLSSIADQVIQLQDIDDTGIAQAHAKAMTNLDLYTADLPDELRAKKDRRGNACKDIRDFLQHYRAYDFKQVINTALPYRFWDYKPNYSGKGDDKVQIGFKYEFNNVQAYYFLGKNGFYRLATPTEKDGYMFVKVEGNIVTQIKGNEVKNYVHKFLKDRYMPAELRNSMYKTTQLSDSSLSNLPLIEINFDDNSKHDQYYFFPNVTLHITADGITTHKPGSVKRYIWNTDVLEHHFKLQPDEPFTIWMDDNTGQYDIKINRTDDLFLNYLIQTSRIHWRVELETRIKSLPTQERQAYLDKHKFDIAGPLLTEDEITEQKLHLINKIFIIGYMLHHFKDPDKPWCIFAMDNNISEDGGSYGGSGKSILFNVALAQVLHQQFYIGGRNPKITENQFIYDGLTPYHRYICIDDAHEFLNFHFFFDVITGKLKVNPKNTSPYTIPYKYVPKFCISSNYTLRNIDPSVERRILYGVFSDYYHNKSETATYLETRKPSHDFGKNLFDDFTREEWNTFFNTMMYSLKFYLGTTDMIAPPMSNVNTRNLKAEMGPDFEEFAASYFDEGSSNVDQLIMREEAFKEFDYKYRKGWKTQRFTKALRAFCKLHNYELNPSELHNSNGGRIIHKAYERQMQRDGTWLQTDKIVSKEYMYIRTHPDKPINNSLPVVSIKGDTVQDLPAPPDPKQNEIDF
ncbi:hypothetical protein ACR78H_25040 [Sphingobacterium siyangense]|uniref:hypothetical protein n=1 Tax=Sphingobacterium siyangense TaxID=459529 RepID=UPI003DA41494